MKRLLFTWSLAASLLFAPASASFTQAGGEARYARAVRRLVQHQRHERQRIQNHEQRARRRAAQDGLTPEERARLREQARADRARLRQHQQNERQRLRDHRPDGAGVTN